MKHLNCLFVTFFVLFSAAGHAAAPCGSGLTGETQDVQVATIAGRSHYLRIPLTEIARDGRLQQFKSYMVTGGVLYHEAEEGVFVPVTRNVFTQDLRQRTEAELLSLVQSLARAIPGAEAFSR